MLIKTEMSLVIICDVTYGVGGDGGCGGGGRVYEIDTQKTVFSHTNFVHFFEAVNYHTKKLKRLKTFC